MAASKSPHRRPLASPKRRTPRAETDAGLFSAHSLPGTLAVACFVVAVWGVDVWSFLTSTTHPNPGLNIRFGIAGLAQQINDSVDMNILLSADLAWLLTVFFFINNVVDNARDSHVQQGLGDVHSLALCLVGSFAGGVVLPLMTGNAQVYCCEETFLWTLLAAWLLTHKTQGRWTAFYRGTPALKLLGAVLFQVFRAHQIINFCTMSNNAFRADRHSKSKFFGAGLSDDRSVVANMAKVDPPPAYGADGLGAGAIFNRMLGPLLCGTFGGSAAGFLLPAPSLAPITGRTVSPGVLQAFAAALLYWGPVMAPQLPPALAFPCHAVTLALGALCLRSAPTRLFAAFWFFLCGPVIPYAGVANPLADPGTGKAAASALLVLAAVFNGGSIDLTKMLLQPRANKAKAA